MPTYAADRSRAAIRDSVYRTQKRLERAGTDEERAKLSALLDKHRWELGAHDAAKPVSSDPLPAGKKRCSKCKAVLDRNEHNFVRRADRRYSWYSECRRCVNSRRRAIHEAKMARDAGAAGPAPARAKPGPKPDGLTAQLDAHERERDGRAGEILLLIRRYEAVREIPGPDRAYAYDRLGLALKEHGWPVSDGVREWSWSRGLGEITTRKIHREWRPPSDPHADPRRVARDELSRAIDLIEMS